MNKENTFLSNLNKMVELRRALNKMSKKGPLQDYHYTEIRCLALIGMMEEANVTKLSEAFYMTRGGVSKTIKKLLGYGVIESYQKPENKKEIYFKLTDKGREVYRKYDEFTIARNDRDKVIFNDMSEAEKDVIIKFLERFNGYLEEQMCKEKVLNSEDENT